jgi:carbamoyltransferase
MLVHAAAKMAPFFAAIDSQLVAAAEEERFTRKKHDYDLPKNVIQFCLDAGGVRGAGLDYVVFFEKPFRKFDRILATVLQTYPQSWKVFRESMITWMLDKLWVASKLESDLGVPKEKVLFSEHHVSHAASAFLCSPFREQARLHSRKGNTGVAQRRLLGRYAWNHAP